jgi:predicted anti-sigma-YlaC factor YlaD
VNACSTFADLLDDAASGAPPAAELVAHLRGCEACRSALERKRALMQRIDDAVRDIVAGIGAPQRRRRPGILRAAGLAAAAALVLAAIGFAWHATHATAQVSIETWRSPTADFLRPTVSILDFQAP